MRATMSIGLFLIAVGLVTFIAYQYGYVVIPDPPPPPPPPPGTFQISVIFKQDTLLGGFSPIKDETFRVEDTGATVTSVRELDPTKCPVVSLGAHYTYSVTAITYGPFDPPGIASSLNKKVLTPSDLDSTYAIVVTCIVRGSWPSNSDPARCWYSVEKIELIHWPV